MKPSIIELLNTCGPTRHFERRARERGLSREIEEFIITWGTTLEAPHDATYFTIVRRDLPDDLGRSKLARQAEGWVLVVASQGAILTCYRRRDAWRTLRKRRDVRTHGGRRAA